MNQKEMIRLVVIGVAGVSAGAAAGFLFAKKKYRALAEEEISSVKETYRLLRKEDYPTPGDLVTLEEIPEQDYSEEYVQMVDDLGYSSDEDEPTEEVEVEVEVEEASVTVNIFEQANDPEETDIRDPEKPYIISEQEFMDDEPDFDKITLEYWEEDDTLTDDRQSPIQNVEGTIGRDALRKFGHLSGNNDIVYVRNEKRSCDYEVARDSRAYTVEVLGLREWEADNVTSKTGVLKMRDDD